MRDAYPTSPSVVVGIDGSLNALTAALWAIDEAIDRDIPLRLIYAIEPRAGALTTDAAARDLAAAETAVRMAFMAVESANKPVKIEAEILQGRPTDVLLQAGNAAAMLCVGAIGFRTATGRRMGSTAAALASWSQCPVAIIRGCDPNPATPKTVLVEVDQSADSDAVLEHAIAEAVLRNAALMVVSVWQSKSTDVHEEETVAERNRLVKADLTRCLARTTREHPALDIRPVAVHGNLLPYLSRHAGSTQLVVVGSRREDGVGEMVGAALNDTACSVLVCNPTNPL